MLYYLLYGWLQPYFSPLNVFRYITVRTAFAGMTALAFGLIFGPAFVRRLRALQVGQFIREEGPESHKKKAGTPTMGGLLIILSIVISTVLWADVRSPFVLLALFSLLAFGAIGFADDYAKVVKQQNLGLRGRTKLFLQFLTAFFAGIILLLLRAKGVYSTALIMPFFKRIHPELVITPLLANPYLWSVAYLPFLIFLTLVIVGSSNAVNLTDGLDGLAIGCVVVASGALSALTYVSSHAGFASYLDLPHSPRVGELTIFCGAMSGSALAFLWYNAHPADVFMGDVGSLALGGAIGTVAAIIKQEILLFFIGGIFVIEALSVILQVGYYKLTRKRIFRMAPLHHHFEQIGWSESKVIVRFWIASLVFALFALTTLKLR